MKRRLTPSVVAVSTFAGFALLNPVHAQETDAQLRQLQERLERLEQNQVSIPEQVTFSGLIETEAGYADAPGGGSTSDIVLATAEFGIQAAINDWIQAGTVFLYEEDDTPLEVDVGLIRLGNLEKSPYYLQAGQYYVPFGNFGTAMVSDPMTLEIGETRESAIQLGFEQGPMHAALYTFNGDTTDGDEDRIDQFGAKFGYSTGGLNAEAGYLSNLADSDSIQGALPTTTVADYVGAATLYADYQAGPFKVIGEYLGATDPFDAAQLAFDGDGAEPQAANIEGNYATRLAGLPATIALGYQQTDEALALGLPASRALTAVSVEIHPQASVSLEWARDDDYDRDEGGTGEESDTVTLQLAAEF